MSGTNPNTDWSSDWNSWHLMKVAPCRSVGDTADVIPGVLSSKSSNSKFSESFEVLPIFTTWCLMPPLDHGMLCWVGAMGQGGAWCRGFLGPLVGGCHLDTKREGTGTQSKAAVGGACSDCETKGDGPANMQGVQRKSKCRHLLSVAGNHRKEQKTKISQSVWFDFDHDLWPCAPVSHCWSVNLKSFHLCGWQSNTIDTDVC